MATTLIPVSVPPDPERAPLLENGDRLTRSEFERRYQAMPDAIKAELIEGVVHLLPSPVRMRRHGVPQARLIWWLSQYAAATPELLVGANSSLRMDLDNEPQPDALLMIEPELGGQAGIDDEDYITGAPELVAEIASSTASYDLHTRLHAYRRNGVREYVVWRVLDGTIDWFALRESRYDPLSVDAAGCYLSEIFPGLCLDPTAMVAGDLAAVDAALQAGLATPEHSSFESRLRPSP